MTTGFIIKAVKSGMFICKPFGKGHKATAKPALAQRWLYITAAKNEADRMALQGASDFEVWDLEDMRLVHTSKQPRKPVTVSLHHTAPAERKDAIRIDRTQMQVGRLVEIEQALNDGIFDHVDIVGMALATGWRLWITRPVRFIAQATEGDDAVLRAHEAQAASRIVEKPAQIILALSADEKP